MRRKVIKQGHNTLTVTIPTSWAKLHNINSGDEVEVDEQDSSLYISPHSKLDKNLSTTLDIKGLDIPTIWKYLMAIYREGYNEIRIEFDPNIHYPDPFKIYKLNESKTKEPKKLKEYSSLGVINYMAHRFIGLEVIESHQDYCILHDLAEPSQKEFETSLRRVFLLIQQMSEELGEAIKNNKPSLIEHTQEIDIAVDKFHDYCIRILNKTKFKGYKKSHTLFATLYLLELLGDEYKHISHKILTNINNINLKNLEEMQSLVNAQFETFYDVYYNFDRDKIVDYSKRDFEIHFYAPKNHDKKQTKPLDKELQVFSYYRRISQYLNALLELRIEMEY